MPDLELPKVLIVEDHADVRGFIQTVLRDEGFDLRGVPDARKARKAIDGDPPLLVITDVLLPGGEDGVDLARYAAAQGCAVLVVTASRAREEEIQAGGFRYLFKPFKVTDLIRQSRAAIRDRRGDPLEAAD